MNPTFTRTKSRNLFVIFSCMLALAFVAYSGSETKTYAQDDKELHKTYDLSPGAKITLYAVSGRVRIESWNENHARVDAVKRGKKEQFAAVKINIVLSKNNKKLHIDTVYPRGYATDVDVDYTIKIPRFATLQAIKSVSSEIFIEGPTGGSVIVVTTSGNIEVKSTNGYVSAKSKSGTIKVKDVSGEIHATSVSGNVHIKDSQGRIHSKSTSGKVDHDNVKST